MTKPTVLVPSAAGRIGKELIALLSREGGFRIRVCCLTMDKADSLNHKLWQGKLWKKGEDAMRAAAEATK